MGVTLGGKACCDPGQLRTDLWEKGIPVGPWLNRANLFTCPAGREWGTGAVLLLRQDLDYLDMTADHTLLIEDEKEPVSLKRLTVVRSEAVVPGAPGEPARVYVVELADRRFHLSRIPIDKAYNLRDDAGNYLTATLNSGTAWTWTQLVSDLWGVVGTSNLGAYPGLPFTPNGTPEQWDFFGGNAWDALNTVLERLACVLDYDPVADSFAVVQAGTVSTAEGSAFSRLAERDLHWEGDPVDPFRGARPQFVRVRFLRVPAPTGGTSPYWLVDVTLATAAGVVAGSYVQLDDDLAALGATGTPSNGSALSSRAVERGADWLRKYLNRDRRLRRVYRDLTALTAIAIGATATRATWDGRGRALKAELESGPDGALERWRIARRAAGFGFMDVRITAKAGSGASAVYTGNVAHQTAANTWADLTGPVTLTTVLRIPSSAASPAAGSPTPPDIPTVGTQHMAVTLDPDVSGYYRIIGPAGGQLGGAYDFGGCSGGSAVTFRLTAEARDWNGKIEIVSPPPPPPPTTDAYYCVNGASVYVPAGGTPPPKFDCGPSSIRIDCATCTPVGTGGGIGITDSTAYADPYTTGDTITLSLAKTGAFVGTPTWDVYVVDDPAKGHVTGAHGTGNTFGPTIGVDAVGTDEFLVMLTDSGDPTKLALATITRTVNPPVTPVRSGATENLTDDDANRTTLFNTPIGGTALTVQVSALSRAYLWWRGVNTGIGNLTISQTAGELVNGAASVVVAAGVAFVLSGDNLSSWRVTT